MNSRVPNLLKLVAAAMLFLVAACGGTDKANPASQVVAKVNKNEISVHQINDAITRYAALPDAEVKQARAQVLEKLIDQELLVQKAVDSKLDRDPRIMQAIEGLRRQMLAQAYLERATASIPKPSAQEIRTFYAEHPQLFSERRIYRLQEVAVGDRDVQPAQLQSEVAKAKSINDITAWLKANNIKFRINGMIRAAEQLPLESLPKFHTAKDGQIVAVSASNGAIAIVQIADSQVAPLSEREAVPYIEQFLQNQFREKLAEKEIKQLRDVAKVEYVGGFGGTSGAAAGDRATADNSNVMKPGISGMR